MKTNYIHPKTELIPLHADANLCYGLAGVSDKSNPNSLGKQNIPGVRLGREW